MTAYGGRAVGQKVCRYEYDSWLGGDGRLYVKTTAIEYERVSELTFQSVAQRRLRRELREQGYVGETESVRYGLGVEEWDRSHNIADGLLETMTFRTKKAVPVAAAA